MARRQGHRISNIRVRQVRADECLTVPPPRKKQSRRGISTGKLPQKAVRRGQVWTWDFIHDTTVKGGAFRTLSVVDEFTREVHTLHVERHIGSGKVREILQQLVAQHGAPDYICSDNGPEFVARSLQDWLAGAAIKTLYIEPGCPWQNGYVESSGARWTGAEGDVLRRSATGGEHQSFHDKFRRECLARELFYTLTEARVLIGDWRRKFNLVRPHRCLGMKTPVEYAALHQPSGGPEARTAAGQPVTEIHRPNRARLRRAWTGPIDPALRRDPPGTSLRSCPTRSARFSPGARRSCQTDQEPRYSKPGQ